MRTMTPRTWSGSITKDLANSNKHITILPSTLDGEFVPDAHHSKLQTNREILHYTFTFPEAKKSGLVV
jgi:hypothetical protein